MAALAHSRFQDDVHPLLRHPKPIKRDFAKAQRMLGLVAENEEHLKRLQREKSVTTRWLERPLYESLDMPDMEPEREEAESGVKDQTLQEDFVSSEASRSVEPKIPSDAPPVRQRPLLIACPQPKPCNTEQFLAPERCASPITMSPDLQRSRPISMSPKSPTVEKRRIAPNISIEPAPQNKRSESWNPTTAQHMAPKRAERAMSFQPQTSTSLSDSATNEPRTRPRPSSFATYSQARNRSSSKIASSRGLRNNSYPNFSRPISGIAPKVIPGEQMEKDTLCPENINGTVNQVYSLPSPSHTSHGLEEDDLDKSRVERKPRNRWSAIPDTFKKLTKRRPSAVANDSPDLEVKIEALRRANFTEEYLPRQQNECSQTAATFNSRFLGPAPLPTPTSSPLNIQHPLFESPLPLPFAPWANGPPSPATSMDKISSSPVSALSSTKRNMASRLTIDCLAKPRPTSLHSTPSSVAMPSASSPHSSTTRSRTPVLERTCILCKSPKSPVDFINHRITANCWHEPATCLDCLQDWIETFFDTHGSERCPCPECGESMTYEDIGAFADVTNL